MCGRFAVVLFTALILIKKSEQERLRNWHPSTFVASGNCWRDIAGKLIHALDHGSQRVDPCIIRNYPFLTNEMSVSELDDLNQRPEAGLPGLGWKKARPCEIV